MIFAILLGFFGFFGFLVSDSYGWGGLGAQDPTLEFFGGFLKFFDVFEGCGRFLYVFGCFWMCLEVFARSSNTENWLLLKQAYQRNRDAQKNIREKRMASTYVPWHGHTTHTPQGTHHAHQTPHNHTPKTRPKEHTTHTKTPHNHTPNTRPKEHTTHTKTPHKHTPNTRPKEQVFEQMALVISNLL